MSRHTSPLPKSMFDFYTKYPREQRSSCRSLYNCGLLTDAEFAGHPPALKEAVLDRLDNEEWIVFRYLLRRPSPCRVDYAEIAPELGLTPRSAVNITLNIMKRLISKGFVNHIPRHHLVKVLYADVLSMRDMRKSS